MKELPSCTLSEQALLGCFIQWPLEVGGICAEAKLQANQLHHPAHSIIFAALLEMWSAGKPIDLVTVVSKVTRAGEIQSVGGAAYISETLSNAASPHVAKSYIEEIQDKSLLRSMIVLCKDFSMRCVQEHNGPQETLSELSKGVAALTDQTTSSNPVSLKQALMEKLDRIQNEKPDDDIIPTGLSMLDRHSPLRRGDMALICGETKAGKSILSLTLATNIALKGGAVLYFSLEDRTPKVIDRLFAGVARIPAQNHHVSRMKERDMASAVHAIERLSKTRFDLRDDVFRMDQVLAIARQKKAMWPDLSLIVLDYAQLAIGSGKSNENREQEVSAVGRDMRLLGMETGAAIMLLSQLNKNGESRESKALEMHATAIWKVQHTSDEEEENTHRDILVPRQRNGDSGIGFKVAFFGSLARVENMAE